MSPRKSARPSATWLLSPGIETCEFCETTFHLEVGYHCVDCDRPICPVCVVTVRERSVAACPQCPDGGGD